MGEDYEKARNEAYLLAVRWQGEFGMDRFREMRNGFIDGLTEFTIVFGGPFSRPKIVWRNTAAPDFKGAA